MAESEKKQPPLGVGSKVFLPGHGVAEVVGREERDFGGTAQVFFAFTLSSGSKLMVPSARLGEIGVRELVSPKEAQGFVRRIAEDTRSQPVRADMPTRKRRAASHAESLVSGSAEGYLTVLLELLSIAKAGKLSSAEKRTLESVRRFFLDEVSSTLKVPPSEIETKCQI